ncbi:MAG: 2-oxoacid:acceptor oxidoreductase family protein, partial [Bacteroidales bacterium]
LAELDAVRVPAGRIAREAGSPKSANVVLMGALSTALPFEADIWRSVIAERVPPKTIEANLAAFDAGRGCVA